MNEISDTTAMLMIGPGLTMMNQSLSSHEAAVVARITQEMPQAHALMEITGRYEMIVGLAEAWAETLPTWFADHPRSLWANPLARALAVDRLIGAFANALDNSDLSAQTVNDATAFFTSDLGQRVNRADFEVSQTWIIEPDRFEAAFLRAQETGVHRPQIARFIDAGCLIERALHRDRSLEMAHLRGLRDGGYFDHPLSDRDLRASVGVDLQAARDRANAYYSVYAVMMEDALGARDMAAYLTFLETGSGQAAAAALHTGGDALVYAVRYEAARILAPIWRAAN